MIPVHTTLMNHVKFDVALLPRCKEAACRSWATLVICFATTALEPKYNHRGLRLRRVNSQ